MIIALIRAFVEALMVREVHPVIARRAPGASITGVTFYPDGEVGFEWG